MAQFAVPGNGAATGTAMLEWVVAAIHAMIGTEMTAGVSFRSDGQRLDVEAAHTINVPDAEELVRRCRRIAQTSYDTNSGGNGSCAGDGLHNKVLVFTCSDNANDNLGRSGALPISWLGARSGHAQMCVMICDGRIPLAWLAGWQTTPFGGRQKRVLDSIVGPLRTRLIWEHECAETLPAAATLCAALEAVTAPVLVVDYAGAIVHSNGRGRRLLDGDQGRTARSLAEAVQGRPSALPWDLTPLRHRGAVHGFLAVLRSPPQEMGCARLVQLAAARWRLTARQQEVLDLVARGMTNTTIATMLAITESTVEFHVTSIFDKTGVDNRASLLARLIDI